MRLADAVVSAWRNWWLLVLCAAVAAGATLFLTLSEEPRYRSSLRLAVGPSPTLTRQTRIAQAVDSLNKRTLITTFAEIAGGRTIFLGAVADLGLPPTEASRYSVSSVALPEANVIGLDVQGPRRGVAEDLVRRVGARSAAYLESFYKTFSVRELDEPTTPDEPVTPKPGRDVPLAAVSGLALGFFLGLCRDHVRRRRRIGVDPVPDPVEP